MDNLFGSSGLQLLAQGNETPVSALASKQVSPVGFRVIYIANGLVGARGESFKRSPSQVVGLYFSAHWCPPCRGFTPKLAEAYTAIVGNGKSLEIVFVSSDLDEAAFASYYKEMPWLALPFAERELQQKLSEQFKVSSIPSLILLDGMTGEVISEDGRTVIIHDPAGKGFPWRNGTVEVRTIVGEGKKGAQSRMYGWMDGWMDGCIHTSYTHIHTYIHTYINISIYHICENLYVPLLNYVCMYVWDVCMYGWMDGWMYAWMYTYILYIFTYIYM
jgi:thiol-disulfide isomerase/thioredoxin